MKNPKGVFEKVPGSGQCWIRYADATGKIRRELAGTKSTAIALYRKRKTEVLMGKKLPETLRARSLKCSELAEDARQYCRTNNLGQQFDQYRIGRLVKEFGNRNADIPVEDLRSWFSEQKWEAGTYNRYKSMLSLIYRLGMENGKVNVNPARLLRRKREDNGRIRFLDQHTPDEEVRLRSVIAYRYASHMPEFDVALHTGMRPSEQYGLAWDRVDLVRRSVTIPKSKNGNSRHIPLNSIALSAFRQLFQRSSGSGRFFVNIYGEPLKGYKHWFEPAMREAGVADFTWYCLRHTFASRLAMAGVDLRTVAELMGHKTIQMTMRYAHLAPAHTLAAVERLARVGHVDIPTDTKTDTSRFGFGVAAQADPH